MSILPGRRSIAALAAGAAAVAWAWILAGPSTPPLYDTILPAAPYLFYCVPTGYQQARAPRPVTQSEPVVNGALQGDVLAVSTDEPPISQVQILVSGSTLNLPPGAKEVTGTITPIATPSILPSDGQIDGSAYTVSVTSGGQPVTMKSGENWTIVLRGVTGKGTAAPEQFDGTTWKRSTLIQSVGQQDVYAANFTTFGTFALVLPGPPATPEPCSTFTASAATTGTGSGSSTGGSGAAVGPLIAIVAGLVAVGAAVLVVRSRRA